MAFEKLLLIDKTKEPDDVTIDEANEVHAQLVANVNDGHADVLNNLPAHLDELLRRMAFHDGHTVKRLERDIQNAIRESGRSESDAKSFKLTEYLDYAKEWKKSVAEEKKRENAIRRRNFKVIPGSGERDKLAQIEAETNDLDVQAKLYSDSSFLKAVGMIKSARPGRIWYDTFLRDFRTDWDGTASEDAVAVHQVDDKFYLRVFEWLIMSEPALGKGLSMKAAQDAVMLIGFENERSEAREWLTSLQWDGVRRLDGWLGDVYGVPRDDYHRDVGRIWMISMAARIMRPGCKVDTMPVLIGPQGNGKSTSLAILGGRWYATINTSIDKQSDFLMSLNGLLLAEIAELDAISRAADSRVKSMLSTFQDKYRPPYGRVAQLFERTAILVGSTNDKSFHKDDSGGRRYLPIETYKPVDLEWLRTNRDQLFAEALEEYKGGASWWAIDRDEQERRMSEYHVEDPWGDVITEWMSRNELWLGREGEPTKKIFPEPRDTNEMARWGTLLTTYRVLFEALGIERGQQNKQALSKVKKILTSMGLVEKTVREDGRGRAGRTLKAWRVAETQQEIDLVGC